MRKLYEKSEIWFSIVWIIVYVVGVGLMDFLSSKIGINYVLSLPFLALLSFALLFWIFKNKLNKKYGLCKTTISIKKLLFFIPLALIVSVNFYFGLNTNHTPLEACLFVFTMLFVGLVEELIFRGLLFCAIEKTNPKTAITVSSLTFGIGHVVNLFNNLGGNLVPNICQVLYAIAIGFLFVVIFYRGGSLIPCIVTHILFNAFSLFLNKSNFTNLTEVWICLGLVTISIVSGVTILVLTKNQNSNNEKTKLKENL